MYLYKNVIICIYIIIFKDFIKLFRLSFNIYTILIYLYKLVIICIYIIIFKDFIGSIDVTLGSIIGENGGRFEGKLE